MDMAETRVCCMSADLAFRVAYRRLKKRVCMELTKALSVRISMLLDSLRQDAVHREQGWSNALEQVADLVRVLCSETSAEFQHFYELLLARRLLRYRFISLPVERRVLELLPAMSKSAQMLHDIEQTEESMQRFKKYLLRGSITMAYNILGDV